MLAYWQPLTPDGMASELRRDCRTRKSREASQIRAIMLRPRPLPSGFVPPLRPSLVAEPPSGEDWLHEVKHDGNRTLVAVSDGRARAFSQNGHDWSDKYP